MATTNKHLDIDENGFNIYPGCESWQDFDISYNGTWFGDETHPVKLREILYPAEQFGRDDTWWWDYSGTVVIVPKIRDEEDEDAEPILLTADGVEELVEAGKSI